MPPTTRKQTKVVAPAAPKPQREATPSQVEDKPELRQFPSLSGEPEVEIAERSADVERPASAEHVKVYVVQRNVDGADFDEAMHQRNIDAMRQSLILQGMRPTGDGQFVGQEDGTDAESVRLTYSIPVVPAAIDEQNAPHYVVEADQHAADEVVAEAEGTDTSPPADLLEGTEREGTAGNTESGDNEPDPVEKS